MSAQGQRRPSPILLILLAFFVLAATYSIVVPLGEGPDEAPHFTVIRYIVQHRHLPSTAEEHEAFQPPLYYLLGAGLTSWADYGGYIIKANADYSLEPGRPHNLLLHTAEESWPYRGWALAWHILRLFSALCGVLTVWAVYALGREAFPAQPAVALLMAGITAFSPGLLFLSAVVNNDNLATAVSACLLWQSARVIRGRQEGWRIAGLGIGLGLGVLSKANVGLTAVPIGAALVYAAWRREGNLPGTLRRVLGWGVTAAGLALAVCGWWLWHNYQVHGDPTGWSFILQTNALREGPLTPAVLWWLAKGLVTSFWLRWQGLSLPGWLYALLLALCLTAAAGWVRLVSRRRPISGETRAILVVLALQCLVVLAALLKWTATVLGTDQARLVYPALPAIALVLAKGLLAWVPARRQNTAAGVLVTALVLFGLAVLTAVVAPVFA
ncbi:MAG: glycosyltransferase family 39 protein, partial [Anaerolineae bacterium]